MSLLSSLILPKLEKELLEMEPQIAEFMINQLKECASEVVHWAENKIKSKTGGSHATN